MHTLSVYCKDKKLCMTQNTSTMEKYVGDRQNETGLFNGIQLSTKIFPLVRFSPNPRDMLIVAGSPPFSILICSTDQEQEGKAKLL